jgi:outer membrane lipoprotein-sorting protein
MKRILSFSIVALLLLSLAWTPGISQKAPDVLAKFIEANGGRKAMEEIKDQTISGTFELVSMGMEGSITFYFKEPNKLRQEMEVMGMLITNAYDGEIGWMINPQTGTVEEHSEDMQVEIEREALSSGFSVFLYPEKYGIIYKVKDKETIENIDCIVMEQIFPDGHITTMYIDSETYLLYITKEMATGQMGGDVEQEIFVSDYEKVGGVMFAHTITIYQDGEEFMTATITEVKLNTGLEDSLFEMER